MDAFYTAVLDDWDVALQMVQSNEPAIATTGSSVEGGEGCYYTVQWPDSTAASPFLNGSPDMPSLSVSANEGRDGHEYMNGQEIQRYFSRFSAQDLASPIHGIEPAAPPFDYCSFSGSLFWQASAANRALPGCIVAGRDERATLVSSQATERKERRRLQNRKAYVLNNTNVTGWQLTMTLPGNKRIAHDSSTWCNTSRGRYHRWQVQLMALWRRTGSCIKNSGRRGTPIWSCVICWCQRPWRSQTASLSRLMMHWVRAVGGKFAMRACSC
jgi:hypothetical protein